MQDGLYRVRFTTPLGQGAGVLVLRDGRIQGGDSTMYYVGTFSLQGGQAKASVKAVQHTTEAGRSSVFGVSEATITLSGTANGGHARLVGTAVQAPGVRFEAELAMLEAMS